MNAMICAKSPTPSAIQTRRGPIEYHESLCERPSADVSLADGEPIDKLYVPDAMSAAKRGLESPSTYNQEMPARTQTRASFDLRLAWTSP